jgi:glycosyltransferase involved in cell wall biosynthesis
MPPEITTVIPVYNGECYIRWTLDSLAAQTRRPDRVLVIDDCSTDGTRELVRNYDALHCDLVVNKKNQGLFGNLNRALEHAPETRYLHLLHADDLVKPPFIKDLVATLEDRAPLSFSYSEIEWINEQGEVIEAVAEKSEEFEEIPSKRFIVRQGELDPVCCGSLVFKTDFKELPCRFRLDYPQVADVIFYAELARQSPAILNNPRGLCQMRSHSNSATSANRKNIDSWVIDEWRAMEMIADWIPEGAFAKGIRRHKLNCLFAARSVVKQQMTRKADPEFAGKIGVETRRRTGFLHYSLGRLAVAIRDTLNGPNKLTQSASS